MSNLDYLRKEDIRGDISPVIAQYLKIKEEYKEGILLFRIGEFYETYFDDAFLFAKICDIKLTKKELKIGKIPLAGIPSTSLNIYIGKLLDENIKISICEQTPDDEGDILKRKVSRTFSAGTIVENELLNSDANNYLCAVKEEKDAFYLSYCDVSTGDFFVTKGSADEIKAEIEKINPQELLIEVKTRDIKPFSVIEEPKPDISLEEEFLKKFNITLVPKHYFSHILAKGKDKDIDRKTANAIMAYVLENQKGFAPSFGDIKFYDVGDYLIMSENTRKCLELTKNTVDFKKYGSLFWAIDKTQTKMGRRLLESWIKRPLRNIEKINQRQEAVKELIQDPKNALELKEILGSCYDIKRLWGKLTNKTILPKDFLSLKETLFNIEKLKNILRSFKSPMLNFIKEEYDELISLAQVIDKTISDNPNDSVRTGGVIKKDASAELDYLKLQIQMCEKWFEDYISEQKELTGIKALKLGFSKLIGYYLEVPNSSLKNIPLNYQIRQGAANSTRFLTAELAQEEEKIKTLKLKQNALEEDIFSKLQVHACELAPRILDFANEIAQADVLQSFYFLHSEENFSIPTVCSDNILNIKSCFHPAVKKIEGTFVENDLKIGDKFSFVVLTGPNMAGKSTFLKQNAIAVILAQMGCCINAEGAKIGIADKIFTRVGSNDELIRGKSTFMVEMLEIKEILEQASSKSIVLLDELGKGTSTADGLALACVISEYLIEKICARTLFATHFHKLSILKEKYPKSVQNLMIGENFDFEKGEFERHVKVGFLSKSYGINVAKVAGLPDEVVKKARDYVN